MYLREIVKKQELLDMLPEVARSAPAPPALIKTFTDAAFKRPEDFFSFLRHKENIMNRICEYYSVRAFFNEKLS